MTPNGREGTTPGRPRTGACHVCWSPPEHQVAVQTPTGWAWRCTRCNATATTDLPFDPRVPPEGREEAYAAIEAICLLAPIFGSIDRDLIYRIVRPYFNVGWTVRDVVYAINYLPDGQTHPGDGKAWVRGEPRDTTLARLLRRLRTWRWKDIDDDGSDIMKGPDTATVNAMATMARKQQFNAEGRRIAEQLQDESARLARERGASSGARRVAALAVIQARQARRSADELEQKRLAADIARGREASTAWLSQREAELPARRAEE